MITLKKNKIIYTNNIRKNHEDYICEEVDSIIPYLIDFVRIDDDFTLGDFFCLVERDKELMQVVFSSQLGHYPLASFIKEIQRDCMAESQEDMDYIELSWVVEQFDYSLFYQKHKDDVSFQDNFGKLTEPIDDGNEISIYVDVHGWGKNTDREEGPYPDDTHISYAIEYTPLYRMKHLPIKLNFSFVVSPKNAEIGEALVEGEREFTVFDVFGAILSEISFLGEPENRDKQFKEITDDIEDMKDRYSKYEREDDDEEKN